MKQKTLWMMVITLTHKNTVTRYFICYKNNISDCSRVINWLVNKGLENNKEMAAIQIPKWQQIYWI